VSLVPSATLDLLERLNALDTLDEVVRAELLELDGAIVRFTHPLLAAGAQARLGPEERRRLHDELARGLDDPVERAVQLAQARLSESEETAAELAAAASIAFRRAQPTIAAELAEAAARLTPGSEPERLLERRLLAARSHAQAGAHEVASGLLEELIPRLRPGVERADALCLHAKVTPDIANQRELLLQALGETDGLALRVEANALLVRNYLYAGDLASALAAAEEADALAYEAGDATQVAAATTIRGMMEIWGRGAADPRVLDRARELVASEQDLPADTYSNPHTLLAARSLYRYEADEARREYAAAVAAAELAGDVDSLETYWWGLAQLEVRAGRFEEADALVARLRESVETYDLRRKSLRWIEGVLATYRGRAEEARAALDEVIAQSESEENWFFIVYGRAALGFLELSLGDAPAAIGALDPVLSTPLVIDGDPGQTGVLPVAAEALVATGELDRAYAIVARLEERGRELSHAWCVASAGRCRGLLLGAAREFESAFAVFADALEQHDRIPAPFERARTLLALGSVQGRARKRRAARESLEAAESVFEVLGTPLWGQKARAELDRVGGRAEAPGELTPHERRIAELVRDGLTNKEVAAALFVSDRTVESALTQIYRKLDVRSRTELARKLGSDA
jgi:DNA-binding CsgD family transcriptional regulator/tetratricopeptide (TPR) repeat protein